MLLTAFATVEASRLPTHAETPLLQLQSVGLGKKSTGEAWGVGCRIFSGFSRLSGIPSRNSIGGLHKRSRASSLVAALHAPAALRARGARGARQLEPLSALEGCVRLGVRLRKAA